jgi:Domain of unknown function (DUF4338)
METLLRYRGRSVTATDVRFINELVARHAGKSRRRLSASLCEAWEWREPNGALRDMVARGLMLALCRAGYIELPQIRQRPCNPLVALVGPETMDLDRTPVCASLRELGPVELRQVRCTPEEQLFNSLLHRHHYLGYTQPVGEHLKFTVYTGSRPVALFAFTWHQWSHWRGICMLPSVAAKRSRVA